MDKLYKTIKTKNPWHATTDVNEIPPVVSKTLDPAPDTSIAEGILTGMMFSASIHNGNTARNIVKRENERKLYNIY